MSQNRPVVWALVHDMERTGVPIALQRMLAWHATELGGELAEIHVVAGHDGPLAPAVRASAVSVTTLEPRQGRSPALTVGLGAIQLGAVGVGRSLVGGAWRHRTGHLPSPDVVLVHGAGAGDLWRRLAGRPAVATARLVVHLHELHEGLARSLPGPALPALMARADAVMAVCEPVAALARGAGAQGVTVEIVSGVTDPAGEARGVGGVPHDAPVVAAIGAPGWRKGSDRFLAIAHELTRTHPSASCRWVGGRPEGEAAWAVGSRLPVTWLGPVVDPWAALPRPAVLVVPSREDPFPLVVLEAAVREVPVVAAATGGLPGLLRDGRGLVRPGHDLAALVRAIESCLDDRAAAVARARALARHVAYHHTAGVVGPRWLATLLGQAPARRTRVRPAGS